MDTFQDIGTDQLAPWSTSPTLPYYSGKMYVLPWVRTIESQLKFQNVVFNNLKLALNLKNHILGVIH